MNPKKLEFALNLRGLSKKDLAKLMKVTPRTITNYLNGRSQPDLNSLGRILKVSPDFFEKANLPIVDEHAVSFRSYSRMHPKLKKMALSNTAIAFALDELLNKEYELKTANLPDLSSLTPAAAAQTLRYEWGLGDKPIPNFVALLESKGIRVFSIPKKLKEINAFCAKRGSIPYCFINNHGLIEKSRFNTAQALGRLVRNFSQAEKDANIFAVEFLMPEQALRRWADSQISIDYLLSVKEMFGVPITALAARMHKLNMISDWIYHRVLCPQLAKFKYPTNESMLLKKEASIAWRKIFILLMEEDITMHYFASKLGIHQNELLDLTFKFTKTLTS